MLRARLHVDDGRDQQTYAIIGAAMEVHRQLGHGFLEAVYQEALAIELTERAIPHEREVEIPVMYRGTPLGCRYRADFICYGEVIVELKAMREMGKIEQAQVLNYLKASGLRHGLLVDFGGQSLEHKRFII
jgi:GxxExxY protein